MKTIVVSIFALFGGIILYLNRQVFPLHHKVSHEYTVEVREPMAKAAIQFLNSLDKEQKASLVFSFEDEERFNSDIVPKGRKGIAWKDLTPNQQAHLVQLMQIPLSEQGYGKTRDIMQMEVLLKILEERNPEDDYRHPEKYYISIFGDPASGKPWGWRFEGHHISFNFSSVDSALSVTPSFLGANPARVLSGPQEGKRILRDEEEFGRNLMGMLSESQQTKAIISPNAPSDIFTLRQRKALLEKKEGLSAGEMNEQQQRALTALIFVYLNNMNKEVAEAKWKKIQDQGFDGIHFAWAGSLVRGEGHYYRIHGPTLLIEYDNTQNNANHIHTTLRDLDNDYGEDLLRQHYEKDHTVENKK